MKLFLVFGFVLLSCSFIDTCNDLTDSAKTACTGGDASLCQPVGGNCADETPSQCDPPQFCPAGHAVHQNCTETWVVAFYPYQCGGWGDAYCAAVGEEVVACRQLWVCQCKEENGNLVCSDVVLVNNAGKTIRTSWTCPWEEYEEL